MSKNLVIYQFRELWWAAFMLTNVEMLEWEWISSQRCILKKKIFILIHTLPHSLTISLVYTDIYIRKFAIEVKLSFLTVSCTRFKVSILKITRKCLMHSVTSKERGKFKRLEFLATSQLVSVYYVTFIFVLSCHFPDFSCKVKWTYIILSFILHSYFQICPIHVIRNVKDRESVR